MSQIIWLKKTINQDCKISENENLDINLNQKTLGEHFSKEEQAVILGMFVKDTDSLMSKIIESKKDDDAKSLLLYVHSIKGTAANIGADRLFNYAKIIEPKIKNKSVSQNWVEEMQKIYSDLKNEIKILVG